MRLLVDGHQGGGHRDVNILPDAGRGAAIQGREYTDDCLQSGIDISM